MLQNTSNIINSLNVEPNSLTLITESYDSSEKLGFSKGENFGEKTEEFVGVIEVYIHQARDIHNICIYQNQDVYAKIYLTSDPETAVSTQIVHGGGKNPVFNETLKLNVRKIDDSLLKCEIWMLSRVRNYLEDQLLGFASMPLCEIVTGYWKFEREFLLSLSDLFHSSAGFVRLCLEYSGPTPQVTEIPMPVAEDSDVPESVPCELAKIEFPDPELTKENECMVSDYIELSNANFGCGEQLIEDDVLKSEITQSSISSTSSSFSKSTPEASKVGKVEDSGGETVINVTVPKSEVVQQEIVDMYMKSMQQFTESLAKMKLPLDTDNGNNDDSGEKAAAVKSTGQSPRVFYGSRAFF